AVGPRVVVVGELAHGRMREGKLVVVVLLGDGLLRPSARLPLHRVPLLVELEPLAVDLRRSDLDPELTALVPRAPLLLRSAKGLRCDAKRHALAALPTLRTEVRRPEAAPTAGEKVIELLR